MLLYYVYADDNSREHCKRFWDVRDSQYFNETREEAVDRLLARSIKNVLPPWYALSFDAGNENDEELTKKLTISVQVADEDFIYDATFDGKELKARLENEQFIQYGYSDAVESLIEKALVAKKQIPVIQTLTFNEHYDYCMKELRAIELAGDYQDSEIKILDERWLYQPSYVGGENEHQMQRHDNMTDNLLLGLVKKDGRVLATIECCINTIEKEPALNVFSTKFVDRDGEEHLIGEQLPLTQWLLKKAEAFVETYAQGIKEKFKRDVTQYKKQLPIDTLPNVEAVYDWTDNELEKHQSLLLSIEGSEAPSKFTALKNLMQALVLKEIAQSFIGQMDFSNNLDPYKYEALKDKLEKKVVVTDGRFVWEARNVIEGSFAQLDNPITAAVVATQMSNLYQKGEVQEITQLQKSVEFDRDFEYELQYGDWQQSPDKHLTR